MLIVIAIGMAFGLTVGTCISWQIQASAWYYGAIAGSLFGGIVPLALVGVIRLLDYIIFGGLIFDLMDFVCFLKLSFGRVGGQMRRVGIWAVLGSVLMLFWAVLLAAFSVFLSSKRIVIPTNPFVPKYSANCYVGSLAALVAVILVASGTYRLAAAACSRAVWRTASREQRIEMRTKFLLLNPISLPFVIIWAIAVLFSPIAHLIVKPFRHSPPQP
jgi:hypothetical protein